MGMARQASVCENKIFYPYSLPSVNVTLTHAPREALGVDRVQPPTQRQCANAAEYLAGVRLGVDARAEPAVKVLTARHKLGRLGNVDEVRATQQRQAVQYAVCEARVDLAPTVAGE